MTKEELNSIIQQGEGYYTEFKQNYNSDIKKEMVAFANASGGSIFLGINDNGSISGIDITNELLSKIHTAANECDPPVSIQTNKVLNNVLQIKVHESNKKPHRTKGGFYLRVGANAQKMKTDAIVEFLEKDGRVRFDERIRDDVDFEKNFSDQLWNGFLNLSGITPSVNKIAALKSLGAVKTLDKKHYFTNAGLLLFTENCCDFLPHSYITCVTYSSLEKVDIFDTKDFCNDIITNIENALTYIKRQINVKVEITDTVRKEIWEIPKVALREAIVNSVVHRDYLETGARVVIEIFPDRIVISNPGGLPKGLDRSEFGHYSLTRNAVVANLMQRARYIEKLGTGIPRIKQLLDQAGLPEASFNFNHFFSIELQRISQKLAKSVGNESTYGSEKSSEESSEKSSDKIIRLISENKYITIKELAENIGISDRAVEKQIEKLKKQEILERVGADKGGHWEVKYKDSQDK